MRSKERIQEMFGQAVVSAFREFASRDLKSAIDYSTQTFGHIANPEVRDCLAEVFYGCRWFLKVALALQADNNERKSIARFQIIDYGSIAECLLLECCRHALNRKLFKYNYHEHQDPPDCKKPQLDIETSRRGSEQKIIRVVDRSLTQGRNNRLSAFSEASHVVQLAKHRSYRRASQASQQVEKLSVAYRKEGLPGGE